MHKILKYFLFFIFLISLIFFVGCSKTKEISKAEYINTQIKLIEKIQPLAEKMGISYNKYLLGEKDNKSFIEDINKYKREYKKNEKFIEDFNENFKILDKDKLNHNEKLALMKLKEVRQNFYLILERTMDKEGNIKNKKFIIENYTKQIKLIKNNLDDFKKLIKYYKGA